MVIEFLVLTLKYLEEDLNFTLEEDEYPEQLVLLYYCLFVLWMELSRRTRDF